MDALANPVGDGWSFDAETATLTLAGATITGDEQGYGIYAVGNLNIYLAEGTENTISNIMFAIYVDGSLSISGGQLNILGKTTNCAGIFTIQGFYAQNCTLNVEAELYGIVSNGEMQLESCDIQIHVKVLALAGIGLMNISNCTITAISDVTVDEYIANGYVDPPCALVCMGIMTITQSNITAAGLTAGIMADMGEQNEIHIDNSYVFSEGTFSGIMARSAITITGSEVIVPVTGDPETLLSSFDANIPYNGILVMETGPMTITDSSITIDGGPYALGAQILHIRSSIIDISNCIYGIVGLEDLLIEDCEHVHVSTGTIMGDLVLTLGTPIPFAPSAIIPFWCDVTIRNCSDVMADGYIAGIMAPNGKFSLIESNVFAYGGVYGVAGVTASIDDSNVSAHGYWNADQLAAIEQPGQALGIYVLEDITLTSFDVPDAYDIVPDFLSGVGYTFVDFDGNLMADVEVYSTTSPMERDHLEVEAIPTDCCVGDEVSWDSLRVYYVYSDGTRQQLSSSLLEFSEVDTSTPGAKEVTGTYNDMSVTFTLPVHSGFVTQTIAPDLYPECDHMYQHNLDETQTLHWNGARSLTVTFSQETYTEPGCDLIYIYDSNGNEIARYSGGEAAGQTLTIPGDTIHIRMYTDGSVTYFGYSFDSITAELLDHTGDVVEDGHEPTCTEPGRNPMILCDICGIHADGNPYAPELGHIYESVVTDPTPDANGYTTHTCTRCGDSYTDSITIYGAIDNGICGENAQWMLTEDYELVIFGEGAIAECDGDNMPWSEYREQIVSIIVESGITRIGACAFSESHSVTNVTLPDTLDSIGVHAFNNCTALESVSIPDSVTLIDIGAFYNCNRLTGLELPDQLRELYDRSFYGCDGLTQVTIPASVVYIQGNPFQYCRNLTEILVEEGNQEFRSVDGVLYDLYRSVLISYPGAKAGHFTVPDTVTVLNNNCFSDAVLLTSVDLPEGLYSIGDFAFAECDSLESIRIPGSVENCGYGIFLGCISLNDVTLPSGLTCISDAMFSGCTSLESISIPDSVTEILSYAFNGCGLTSLELPDGLIQIHACAFQNCLSLTQLTIPASVTHIGSYGFAGCENLTSIEFLGDAPVIEYDSFINVNATIAVPEDNDTWTGDTMQSYGGNLNWVVRGEIVDLELRSVPDNTFLLVGEELDLKGIEVYVTYDNGTGEVLSPELLTLEVDTSEPGCKTATVSYGGFSASFEIIVHGGTRVELDPSEYPESEHYYPDHLEDTQTVTIPGCDSIVLEFSPKTEVYYILINDGNGNQIARFYNSDAAGIVLEVPGDTVEIRMVTYSDFYYGYSFDRITGLMLEHQLETLPGIIPTCTEPGRTEGTWCTICRKPAGENASVPLPANGHQYEEERIPTSAESIGQIIYTCVACGDSYREDWDFVGEGQCSDTLSWAVEEHALFFMGSGTMPDYTDPTMDISGAAPWYQHRDLFFYTSWHGAVHNIGAYAFSHSGLTTADVPSSVVRIGEGAFSGSPLLRNASLDPGVMIIEDLAFANCPNLEYIDIPVTVTEISATAFDGCDNLTINGIAGSAAEAYAAAHGIPFVSMNEWTSGTYGENVHWVLDNDSVLRISGTGAIEAAEHFTEYPWYSWGRQIVAIIIDEGITEIPAECFSFSNSELAYLSLPASVQKIGSYAWPGSGGRSLTLNVADVESWLRCEFGMSCASGAYNADLLLENGIPVTDLVIPEGVTTLPRFLLAGYTGSFDTITIPASLETVHLEAFNINGSIGTVYAPSLEHWCQINFASATANPLYQAEQLVIDGQVITDVVIPDTVTELGTGIFSGYDALRSVIIPNGITQIPYTAFSHCSNLSSVVLPDTLTAIGDYAFSESSGLTDLVLPSGVTSIGVHAFSWCTNLNSIELSDNLTEIGGYAFCCCYSLTEVIIPANVTRVDDCAFSYCRNLNTIYFLGDAPEFGEPFHSVNATVYYPEGNETWTSDVMQNYSGNLTWVPYTPNAEIAGGECGENLVWSLTMDGVLTISPDQTGLAAVFSSNDMYDYGDGYPEWSQYESRIRSIVVEDGVSYIGAYAFSNLTNVTGASILGKTEIGEYAFYGCTALSELTMNRVTKLNTHAFHGCSALTSLHIPSSLVQIDPCAIYKCTALTDLTVGQGNPCFYVYNGMLYNSSTKTLVLCLPTVQGAVKISNNTRAVDPYAFAGCSGITELQIPASVTDIGDAAFVGCSNLSKFTLLGENPVLSTDGMALFTDSGRKLIAATNQVTVYTVPEGVEEIATYAFGTSDSPVSITLPEGVVTLADYAFAGCRKLETIHLPSTLKSIGFDTFLSCISLSTVNLPEGLTAIGTNAFLGCNSLTGTLRIPGTVTDWGSFAFTGVPLTEVIFGYGLTDLGEGTFYGCSDLTAAHIPSTVTEFGFGGAYEQYDAFSGCDDLVIYAHGDSPAQAYAAENGFGFEAVECSYVSTVVAPTCTDEGYTLHTCTYCNHSYRDGLVRPAGHSYRRDTCEHCGHKLDVIVSGYSGDTQWMLTDNGVLTIYGEGNMKNYSGSGQATWFPYRDEITHVVVEDGVTRIGNYTFYDMEFSSIEIADSVAVIGTYAFKNCTGLSQVELPSGLTTLGESAFYGCSQLNSIEIPASLWTIQPYTFKGCSNLRSVVLPEGNLQKISESAFYGTGLTELVLPDCLDILDRFAFKNCQNLSSITIGSGLTELREAVFYGTAIPSIDIPEGITKIGPYAFKGCTDLVSINLPDTLTCIGESAFYGDTALWVVELPDSVETIDSYAFRLCSGITTLTLGAGLETIGECAFYGCTALKDVNIPDQVTTIEPYAFKGCTKLASVTFGNSLRTLGEGAFHTCTALKTLVFPASLTSIGEYCFSGSYNLWKLTFQGDAPTIGAGAFKGMAATAYYPGNNASWGADTMQNYGGKITWKAE